MAFNPVLHQVFMTVLRANETNFSEKVNQLTVMYQTLNVYNKALFLQSIVANFRKYLVCSTTLQRCL